MIFCKHDLANGKHDLISLENFQVRKSASQVTALEQEVVQDRTICLIMDCDVTFASNYFDLLEEAFKDRNLAVVYTDFEYKSNFSSDKSRIRPPNWSQERFLSNDFLGSVFAFNSELVDADSKLGKSTRTQLLLSCISSGLKLRLIDQLGYVVSPENLNLKDDFRNSEVANFLAEYRPGSKIVSSHTPWSIISNADLAPEKISIVIPTRGSKKNVFDPALITECIQSLLDQDFGNSTIEVIVVFDSDVNLDYLSEIRKFSKSNLEILFIEYTPPFNFSKKCNLGAEAASGEVIIFLNDDTVWMSANSLLEIAGCAMLEGVGAVGAKLFFENGRIQHAGYITRDEFIDHAYLKDFDGFGPFGDLVVTHEVVGVTGACLAQRKYVWESIGKWDESIPAAFNDVDYCFKIREAGLSILQANLANLTHFESLTRNPKTQPEEIDMIKRRWGHRFVDEPFFRMAVQVPVAEEKTVERYWLYAKRTFRHDGIKGMAGLVFNVARKAMHLEFGRSQS